MIFGRRRTPCCRWIRYVSVRVLRWRVFIHSCADLAVWCHGVCWSCVGLGLGRRGAWWRRGWGEGDGYWWGTCRLRSGYERAVTVGSRRGMVVFGSRSQEISVVSTMEQLMVACHMMAMVLHIVIARAYMPTLLILNAHNARRYYRCQCTTIRHGGVCVCVCADCNMLRWWHQSGAPNCVPYTI